MNHIKTSPVNVDIVIQKLQTKLHDYLLTKWGMTNTEYQAHGRCYRNKKANGFVAEVYSGDNEYKDVYWNDELKAISFFGIDAKIEKAIMTKAKVHLIFFVNIKKIKPTITHRADEEIRSDVTDFIGKHNGAFTFESIELYTDNVLREYPGSANVVFDMHPVHCFRLNFSASYKIC